MQVVWETERNGRGVSVGEGSEVLPRAGLSPQDAANLQGSNAVCEDRPTHSHGSRGGRSPWLYSRGPEAQRAKNPPVSHR